MHDLDIYAFNSELLEEEKAAFHVAGVFQAHMHRLLNVLWCRGPTQDPCVSFCYISPKNTLCISLMSFFGWGGGRQEKTDCGGNLSFMFCTFPSAELRRLHSPTLWRLASPSAHNTSSWGILWGGGATEPWNDARIHHHQRSAASYVATLC